MCLVNMCLVNTSLVVTCVSLTCVSLTLVLWCLWSPAGSMSAHHYIQMNPSVLCCLVVDSGYSFTHITPYCRGRKMKKGICRLAAAHTLTTATSDYSLPLNLSILLWRLNVGGKLLTNHLKEIISYRWTQAVALVSLYGCAVSLVSLYV